MPRTRAMSKRDEEDTSIDLVGANMDSTELAAPGDLPKLPQENGFDHFCFGRISAEERGKPDFLVDSKNAPTVELDGFQRVGPFQYMKLPLEIRHMVLGYLIAPFVHKKYGGISVDVDYTSDDNDYVKRKVESYLQKRNEEDVRSLVGGVKSYLKSLEKRQNDGRRHQEEIEAFLRDSERREYEMQTTIYKENCGLDVPDLPTIDLLRNLSNVSTNFREEFGSIFWANICLSLERESLDRGVLQRFLKERPAIHKRIGRLEIPVEFWLHDQLDTQALNNVKSTINYLPKNLEIRHFVLEVFIKKKSSPISPLARECGSDDDEEGQQEELAYCTEVSREHVPAILRFMTPNTLRSPDQKELNERVRCRIRMCGGECLPEDESVCAKTLKQWEAELQMNNPKNLDD